MSDFFIRSRENQRDPSNDQLLDLLQGYQEELEKNEAYIIFSQSQGASKNKELWLHMEQIKQKGCLCKGIKMDV